MNKENKSRDSDRAALFRFSIAELKMLLHALQIDAMSDAQPSAEKSKLIERLTNIIRDTNKQTN